ncbi:MAG: methyl-accepting chemotaxis protein [Deltaproteobacteria bacterium]|nr:methyl-accepting chemotaxis protein [Deltaproteobacteria bacterium]
MIQKVRESLSLKILLATAATMLLLLGVATWHAAGQHRRTVTDLQRQMSGSLSGFVYHTLLFSMSEGKMGDLQKILQNAVQTSGIEFLRVVDATGTVRYSGRPDEVGTHLTDRRLLDLLRRGAESPSLIEARWEGALVGAVPLHNQGTCSTAACHEHAQDGPYLGAILMEYDFTGFEDQLFRGELQQWGVLTGAVLLVIGVLSLCLRLLVLRPLFRVVDGTQRIAQGDLSQPVPVDGQDEMGQLAGHVNTLRAHLRDSIQESESVAEALANAVDELDRSSEGLVAIAMEQSSGAAEQASAVQEATTTSEEIAATSNEISANVESVEHVAEETFTACMRGGDDVKNAVQGMQEVKEKVKAIADGMVELGKKSQKVGGIAEIIDEISEQTHLLALNAAIEAAGAGEHGKRFSVVASEIRRLAERTVEATAQIKELIQEIQDSTNESVLATERGTGIVLAGASRVDKIGESLGEILALVRQTKESAREITIATQQQATAGEQLVLTITDINDVAVQVNRSAEQVEKSVLGLKGLARRLKDLAEENRHARKFRV